MAIKNLEDQFKAYIDQEMKNLKGGFFIPTESITYIKFSSATSSLIEALKKGTKAILLTHDPSLDSLYNTNAKWTTAIRRVSKTLRTPVTSSTPIPDVGSMRVLRGNLGTTAKRNIKSFIILPKSKKKYSVTGSGAKTRVTLNPGVYEEKFSDAVIEFAVVADSNTTTGVIGSNTAKDVFEILKDKIWNEWVAGVIAEELKAGRGTPSIGLADDVTRKGRQRASKGKGGTTLYSGRNQDKRFGTLLSSNVKRAHTSPVTAEIALRRVAESNPSIGLSGISIDAIKLTNYVKRKLNINFSRQRKKVRGVTNSQINVIRISAKENLGDRKDLKPIVNAANTFIGKRLRGAVKREAKKFKATGAFTLFPVLSGLTQPNSKPFVDDVVDDSILALTKNIKKRSTKRNMKVKSKISAKKGPPVSDNNVKVYDGRTTTRASRPKNLSIKLAGITAARQSAASNKPRNAAGRRQDEEMSLPKLKRLINRSLGAEVRRNMGRPALINRTGVFSNSVTLDTLRQGPKTLIGEYSYQTNPYQTFENLGRKQWPQGYNPKPLIAKSIRNLAARHVQAKFTLRRV